MAAQEEPRWLLYRSCGYLVGRGIIYGVGPTFYHQPARMEDRYALVGRPPGPVKHSTDSFISKELPPPEGYWDYVLLGECATEDHIRQAKARLRTGGHLILMRQEDSLFKDEETLRLCGKWLQKDYHIELPWWVSIYKKLGGSPSKIQRRSISSKPKACIARYGALGDLVMITPLIRTLAADGYEVTVNTSPYPAPVLENNPYLSNIIIQERDIIPNVELGPYWEHWKAHYDRYINLSESIEGGLLKIEGRRDFYTPKAWRNHMFSGVNYIDRTMEIGGYPEAKELNPDLHLSKEEAAWAKNLRKEWDDLFVVLWGMKGSSHHKLHIFSEVIVTDFLDDHPNAIVVLCGGEGDRVNEFDHPRILKRSGEWSVRQTIAAATVANCIVGPESFLSNVGSAFDVPKIVFLSHSSRDNLTKYWKNCITLEPSEEIAPCYPCHQLHYAKESCPLIQLVDGAQDKKVIIEGPRCIMGAIPVPAVLEALESIYRSYRPH